MIAMMWLDVVADRGRADDPARKTHAAQRVLSELRLGSADPGRAAVQVMPLSGLVWGHDQSRLAARSNASAM
jgi:hypothetical protein